MPIMEGARNAFGTIHAGALIWFADVAATLCAVGDQENIGRTKGVPMGGDLLGDSNNKSPTFLVGALKDPIGANLDRIQIIKGWMDAEGATHEMVYNVAWSVAEKRQPGDDGRLQAGGNTVDVENASRTNTIGSSELITVWRDPDIDASLNAFYDARVIEIPTSRWTAYDAK
jgi:hypothetical protein